MKQPARITMFFFLPPQSFSSRYTGRRRADALRRRFPRVSILTHFVGAFLGSLYNHGFRSVPFLYIFECLCALITRNRRCLPMVIMLSQALPQLSVGFVNATMTIRFCHGSQYSQILPRFAIVAPTTAVTAARSAASRVVLTAARMSYAATATTAARNSDAVTPMTGARNNIHSTQSNAKPQKPSRCLVSSSYAVVLFCVCMHADIALLYSAVFLL